MLAPSSFARMLHKAPVCQIPVRIPAGSRQIRTAAGPGRKGSANGLRPQLQALPFSSAAAAGCALARMGPAQTLSPPGKCSCLSLLQVLALPPVLRQKQGRVPAERPASRFQPAGSSAWLVFQTLCRLIWPPGRDRWNTKALARQPAGPVPHPLACARSPGLRQRGSAGSPAGRPSRTRLVISNLKGGSTGAGSWGLCQTCTCCFQKKP